MDWTGQSESVWGNKLEIIISFHSIILKRLGRNRKQSFYSFDYFKKVGNDKFSGIKTNSPGFEI